MIINVEGMWKEAIVNYLDAHSHIAVMGLKKTTKKRRLNEYEVRLLTTTQQVSFR